MFAALVARATTPSPPPRTADGVAAMLGAAIGGEVRADDFVWEARGGFWTDAFIGRRVLFVARPRGSAQADLYRARVRLSRAGRPLSLGLVRDLTNSTLGDDRDLVALGHHAAYVTSAFGVVQGVTLLDLDGEGDAREARGFVERNAAAAESWLATGSTRGIGRTEITFGSPPTEVRHELSGDLLVMALGKESLPAALDLHDGSLNTGPINTFAASAQRIPHRAPSPGDVVVRSARDLFGQSPALLVRAVVRSLSAIPEGFRARPRAVAAVAMLSGPPSTKAPEAGWPPPSITPPIQPAIEGEGVWVAGRAKAIEDAPPAFFETALRPDPRKPEALVRLVAMDTRQIDLRLAPGVDEPRSDIGLHGSGRFPEGVVPDRAIAVFASGPAESAPADANDAAAAVGEPGFVVDRRLFVPPSHGLETIAIAVDGHALIGPWPNAAEIPASFASLRQTPDAVLGWSGPARLPLRRASERTERSALGLLPTGQLVYAWGADASADVLAKALELAGCTTGVPLAASPAPAGFAYLTASAAQADAIAPGMSIALTPRSSNDLFYAVVRTVGPPPLPSGASSFEADGGRQPSPAWLPAIQKSAVISLGAQVHVTTFSPGRLAFHIRAGAKEPATKGVAALATTLSENDQPHVLAAIGLASGRRRGARGLTIEGTVGLPNRSEDGGALVVDHGRPRVVRMSDLVPSAMVDATELPLTADEGKLRPEGRDVGTMRARAAACVLEDGTFAVASTTFDSDEAATSALLDLGCARVVALDRGSHQAAFVHRAGTESAPEPRYEATTLLAVEVPLTGRAGPL